MNKMKRVQVILPEELLAEVGRMAQERLTSKSQLLRELIDRELKRSVK